MKCVVVIGVFLCCVEIRGDDFLDSILGDNFELDQMHREKRDSDRKIAAERNRIHQSLHGEAKVDSLKTNQLDHTSKPSTHSVSVIDQELHDVAGSHYSSVNDQGNVSSDEQSQRNKAKAEASENVLEDDFVNSVLGDDKSDSVKTNVDTPSLSSKHDIALPVDGPKELSEKEQRVFEALEAFAHVKNSFNQDVEQEKKVKKELYETLQKFLDEGGDPNVRTSDPIYRVENGKQVVYHDNIRSLLDVSIQSGDPEIVKMLLDKGARVDSDSVKQSLEEYRNFFVKSRRYFEGPHQKVVSHVEINAPRLSQDEKTEHQNKQDFIKKNPIKGRLGFALKDIYDWFNKKVSDLMHSGMKKQVLVQVRKDAQDRAKVVFELYDHHAPLTEEDRQDIALLENEYSSVWSKLKRSVVRSLKR